MLARHGSIEVEDARVAARGLGNPPQGHLNFLLQTPSGIGDLEHGAVSTLPFDAMMDAETELVSQLISGRHEKSHERIANTQCRRNERQGQQRHSYIEQVTKHAGASLLFI